MTLKRAKLSVSSFEEFLSGNLVPISLIPGHLLRMLCLSLQQKGDSELFGKGRPGRSLLPEATGVKQELD